MRHFLQWLYWNRSLFGHFPPTTAAPTDGKAAAVSAAPDGGHGEPGVSMRPTPTVRLMEDEREDRTDKTMKVLLIHNPMAEEDPADVSIVIEGNQVLSSCGNRTKACVLLMGLIYTLKLEYPTKLKYTFEVFQKLFLELDGAKLLKKVQSLKNKLIE